MKKGDCLKAREGEKRKNYQGITMKIIKYRRSNDIDVMFLDGYNILKRTRYEHFISGKVRCNEATITRQKEYDHRREDYEALFRLSEGLQNGNIRPIPSKNGYFADIYGDIYNIHGRKLIPQKRGLYLGCDLPSNGDPHGGTLIHRAVCSAFLPNPDNKPEVNHKNGDKYNNAIGNLEWVTKSENQKHRFSVLGHNHIGENNTQAKLDNEKVIDILARASRGENYKDIAVYYNVSPTTIYNVITRKSWVHISYNENDIKRQVLKL